MRLDSTLLEELMDRARLSLRERETMRLDCSGPLTDAEIAAVMGCAVGSVQTYRKRGRRKLRLAQDAYAREQREQLGREDREQDGLDLSTAHGYYRFLLGAIQPPHHSDHGPHISLTCVQYDLELKREFILSAEAAVHAGPMVTVDDLLGTRYPRMPAAFNRDRLKKKR